MAGLSKNVLKLYLKKKYPIVHLCCLLGLLPYMLKKLSEMPIIKTSIRFLLVFFLAFIINNTAFAQVGTKADETNQAEEIPEEQVDQAADQNEQEEATDVGQDAGAAADTEGIPTDQEAIDQGKTLFQNNCTVCHAVHEQVVGPALANISDRRPLPWLISFIKNSQKVIQSGDDYAVNLYNEFNKTQMPNFDYFSDEEIKAMLAYIQEETKSTPSAGGDQTAPGTEGATEGAATGTGIPSEYLTAIVIGFIIVLVLILVVLALLVTVLTKYLKTKEGLDESDKDIVEQKLDFKKAVKSRPFIGMVAFIFVAIALKAIIDGLFTVGVQQGYAPTQPIAFSHKLHAGQYQIDCNYCHTGVRKSKSANIPSANICMNCHSQIKQVQGQEGESAEIKKIYAAVENNTPIEWVRVHNLPDLAYFNHAQHVDVGGIECQTCHGPIEEMEVVRQHAPLTMGWCIDCHKQTQINTDNEYYAKLTELHDAVSKEPMTVEDIGGLECAKCHY